MIRTRFAPSPTGFLHIGGARTALFCWAFAKHQEGTFILRIEDTDRERSTQESVSAILDGMAWLGLDYEGPYFQMERLGRYRAVAEQLLAGGKAYRCYATRVELDILREKQRARGEKPRYDGRWRPENAQRAGLKPPLSTQPVVRFRNPDAGDVSYQDLVKGEITIANEELDDLVLLRADGIPTYNFGAVVDDIDMKISHVIRGDDHVNNTPRQINIYKALGAPLPSYAHVPMILGADGERLSKRHGAVSVTQYRDDGYLSEALVNYLARLGWSHGDAEMFSREQLVAWFDLEHISQSPARFDPGKLRWLNQQYIKTRSDAELAEMIKKPIEHWVKDLQSGPPLDRIVALFKDRAGTIEELKDDAMMFFGDPPIETGPSATHITAEIKPVLNELAKLLEVLEEWQPATISATFKAVLERHGLKMPKLAVPVRLAVFGRAETPDVTRMLAVAGKERVVGRLRKAAA